MPAKTKKASAPKEEPKKTLAKSDPKPLTQQVPPNFEDDAGAGQENMSRSDYAIPRLLLLQDLSPQVKKSEADYIKGASAGMFCDPISKRLWDGEEGVKVIPISYRRTNIEWKPRNKGGGFVADHGPDEAILRTAKKSEETGKLILPNGNEISTVAEYFIFLLDDDGNHAAYVLTLKGADLKKSRRWNTQISQLQVPRADGQGTFNPAMFYRSYKLTSVPESNDKGSWMGFSIEGAETVREIENGNDIYAAAKSFRDQVTSGAIKAQEPIHERNAESEREDDSKPM